MEDDVVDEEKAINTGFNKAYEEVEEEEKNFMWKELEGRHCPLVSTWDSYAFPSSSCVPHISTFVVLKLKKDLIFNFIFF